MSKNRWIDVSVGDKLYIIEYDPLIFSFNKPASMPVISTAIVNSVEEVSERLWTIIAFKKNREEIKIHINPMLSYSKITMNSKTYIGNKNDSIYAAYKKYDSDNMNRYVTMNKDFFCEFVEKCKNDANWVARNNIRMIKESLRIINIGLKCRLDDN